MFVFRSGKLWAGEIAAKIHGDLPEIDRSTLHHFSSCILMESNTRLVSVLFGVFLWLEQPLEMAEYWLGNCNFGSIISLVDSEATLGVENDQDGLLVGLASLCNVALPGFNCLEPGIPGIGMVIGSIWCGVCCLCDVGIVIHVSRVASVRIPRGIISLMERCYRDYGKTQAVRDIAEQSLGEWTKEMKQCEIATWQDASASRVVGADARMCQCVCADHLNFLGRLRGLLAAVQNGSGRLGPSILSLGGAM